MAQQIIARPLMAHTHDNDSPAEIGFPRPDDAPKDWPDLHVFQFAPDALPEIGSAIETTYHAPGMAEGHRSTATWVVAGYGAEVLCTGEAFHAPLTYRRVYASPLWLVERKRKQQG